MGSYIKRLYKKNKCSENVRGLEDVFDLRGGVVDFSKPVKVVYGVEPKHRDFLKEFFFESHLLFVRGKTSPKRVFAALDLYVDDFDAYVWETADCPDVFLNFFQKKADRVYKLSKSICFSAELDVLDQNSLFLNDYFYNNRKDSAKVPFEYSTSVRDAIKTIKEYGLFKCDIAVDLFDQELLEFKIDREVIIVEGVNDCHDNVAFTLDIKQKNPEALILYVPVTNFCAQTDAVHKQANEMRVISNFAVVLPNTCRLSSKVWDSVSMVYSANSSLGIDAIVRGVKTYSIVPSIYSGFGLTIDLYNNHRNLTKRSFGVESLIYIVFFKKHIYRKGTFFDQFGLVRPSNTRLNELLKKFVLVQASSQGMTCFENSQAAVLLSQLKETYNLLLENEDIEVLRVLSSIGEGVYDAHSLSLALERDIRSKKEPQKFNLLMGLEIKFMSSHSEAENDVFNNVKYFAECLGGIIRPYIEQVFDDKAPEFISEFIDANLVLFKIRASRPYTLYYSFRRILGDYDNHVYFAKNNKSIFINTFLRISKEYGENSKFYFLVPKKELENFKDLKLPEYRYSRDHIDGIYDDTLKGFSEFKRIIAPLISESPLNVRLKELTNFIPVNMVAPAKPYAYYPAGKEFLESILELGVTPLVVPVSVNVSKKNYVTSIDSLESDGLIDKGVEVYNVVDFLDLVGVKRAVRQISTRHQNILEYIVHNMSKMLPPEIMDVLYGILEIIVLYLKDRLVVTLDLDVAMHKALAVCCTPENMEFSRIIIALAKAKSIPSISIQHVMISDSLRYDTPRIDYLGVMETMQKSVYMRLGYDESKITLTGSANLRKRLRWINNHSDVQEIPRTILFAMQHSTKEQMMSIYDIISRVALECRARLIIKPHPIQEGVLLQYISEDIESKGYTHVKLEQPDSDTYRLIKESSMVVGLFSNVLLEAAVFADKNVLIITDDIADSIDMSSQGVVVKVGQDYGEVREVVFSILDGGKLADEISERRHSFIDSNKHLFSMYAGKDFIKKIVLQELLEKVFFSSDQDLTFEKMKEQKFKIFIGSGDYAEKIRYYFADTFVCVRPSVRSIDIINVLSILVDSCTVYLCNDSGLVEKDLIDFLEQKYASSVKQVKNIHIPCISVRNPNVKLLTVTDLDMLDYSRENLDIQESSHETDAKKILISQVEELRNQHMNRGSYAINLINSVLRYADNTNKYQDELNDMTNFGSKDLFLVLGEPGSIVNQFAFEDNFEFLSYVKRNFPTDSQVVFLPNDDGDKQDLELISSMAIVISEDMLNSSYFWSKVSKVFVGGSRVGLEALVRGKQLYCYANSEYSGLGFTIDYETVDFLSSKVSFCQYFYIKYIANSLCGIDKSFESIVENAFKIELDVFLDDVELVSYSNNGLRLFEGNKIRDVLTLSSNKFTYLLMDAYAEQGVSEIAKESLIAPSVLAGNFQDDQTFMASRLDKYNQGGIDNCDKIDVQEKAQRVSELIIKDLALHISQLVMLYKADGCLANFTAQAVCANFENDIKSKMAQYYSVRDFMQEQSNLVVCVSDVDDPVVKLMIDYSLSNGINLKLLSKKGACAKLKVLEESKRESWTLSKDVIDQYSMYATKLSKEVHQSKLNSICQDWIPVIVDSTELQSHQLKSVISTLLEASQVPVLIGCRMDDLCDDDLFGVVIYDVKKQAEYEGLVSANFKNLASYDEEIVTYLESMLDKRYSFVRTGLIREDIERVVIDIRGALFVVSDFDYAFKSNKSLYSYTHTKLSRLMSYIAEINDVKQLELTISSKNDDVICLHNMSNGNGLDAAVYQSKDVVGSIFKKKDKRVASHIFKYYSYLFAKDLSVATPAEVLTSISSFSLAVVCLQESEIVDKQMLTIFPRADIYVTKENIEGVNSYVNKCFAVYDLDNKFFTAGSDFEKKVFTLTNSILKQKKMALKEIIPPDLHNIFTDDLLDAFLVTEKLYLARHFISYMAVGEVIDRYGKIVIVVDECTLNVTQILAFILMEFNCDNVIFMTKNSGELINLKSVLDKNNNVTTIETDQGVIDQLKLDLDSYIQYIKIKMQKKSAWIKNIKNLVPIVFLSDPERPSFFLSGAEAIKTIQTIEDCTPLMIDGVGFHASSESFLNHKNIFHKEGLFSNGVVYNTSATMNVISELKYSKLERTIASRIGDHILLWLNINLPNHLSEIMKTHIKVSRKFIRMVKFVLDMDFILGKNVVATVVTPESIQISRIVTSIANSKKIKSIGIQHMTYSDTLRYDKPIVQKLSVIDTMQRDIFLNKGYHKSKIVLGGTANLRARKRMMDSIKIEGSKYSKYSVMFPMQHSCVNEMKSIYTAIKEVVLELDIVLVVKPHPSSAMEKEIIELVEKDSKVFENIVLESPTADTYEMIRNTDLLVGYYSQVLYEAAVYADRDVIIVSDNYIMKSIDYSQYGLAYKISSDVSSIRSVIEDFVGGRGVAAELKVSRGMFMKKNSHLLDDRYPSLYLKKLIKTKRK